MEAPPVTELQLEEALEWLQTISFSRTPKSLTRDFSDGVLMAEIMKTYYPSLVQIHNYQSANSTSAKYVNWKMLVEKVFRKVGIPMSRIDIEGVVACTNGVIERVLVMIYNKINQQQTNANGLTVRLSDLGNSSPDKMNSILKQGSLSSSMQKLNMSMKQEEERSNFAAELSMRMAEKEMVIKQLRETIEILETKMKKMEQLNKLKDAKIDSLMRKLDQGIGL